MKVKILMSSKQVFRVMPSRVFILDGSFAQLVSWGMKLCILYYIILYIYIYGAMYNS